MKRFFCLLSFLAAFCALRAQEIVCGDARFDRYLSLLEGKRVGIVTNHTGVVDGVHIVDTLKALGVDLRLVFAPEHGFRGTADAGEKVQTYTDPASGVRVVSLYGATRKPQQADVAQVDVILFDIQDVGTRFYTYLSTLALTMEAAAEAGKQVIVLDRPNPNGRYTDGPVMDMKYKSFVGMLPIPAVHGMTLGELARMINGEGWLAGGAKCDLRVIPCQGYRRSMKVHVAIAPSPNLPTDQAIAWYPSLCLLESAPVSIGRGTAFPFEVYGHPGFKERGFSFTPQSTPGAKHPPLEGKLCYGYDLRQVAAPERFDLSYVIDSYKQVGRDKTFFNSMLEKLSGAGYIRDMIVAGCTAEEIRACWASDVEKFCREREPYLIYPD